MVEGERAHQIGAACECAQRDSVSFAGFDEVCDDRSDRFEAAHSRSIEFEIERSHRTRHVDGENNVDATGFHFGAAQALLRAGECQSTVMPLDESLAIMQLLDQIRAQIGLTYPGE